LIVLDTHVWVWWVASPDMLSPAAAAGIDRAIEEDGLHVSAISCWELSLLVRKGRLELTMDVADWIAGSAALPFLRFVPVDRRTATRANQLAGDLHEDPADRLIIATALTLGATLVTKDLRIRDYAHVPTLW
jgi:PIN domain nuclease of toxin-antitoxin system